MNFLNTSTRLIYTIILTLNIALINYVNAQNCFISNDNIELCYKANGIVLELPCSETNGVTTIALIVESVTGGTAPYIITPESGSDGRISETKVGEGGSFLYSFTLDDFQNNRINFQVVDKTGRTAVLNDFIISSISSNLFSGNCGIVDPYFLVSDDTRILAGQNEVFTAIECILLAPTFEVDITADFEANISN